MEKITQAAVVLRLHGEPERRWVGTCHAECATKSGMPEEVYYEALDAGQVVEGFVTTEGRFVDRVEALEVARREKQMAEVRWMGVVLRRHSDRFGFLISEEVSFARA